MPEALFSHFFRRQTVTKTLILAALATLTATAPASAETKRYSFALNGVAYSYTIAKSGETTIYKGQASPGGNFRLVLRGHRVTGMANGNRVAFDVTETGEALAELRQSKVKPVGLAVAAR
jgi:hypothetical protein